MQDWGRALLTSIAFSPWSIRGANFFLFMADSAAEETFPQPRAAVEEAPAAPGQAAPALQPEPAQPAQNEAAERGA